MASVAVQLSNEPIAGVGLTFSFLWRVLLPRLAHALPEKTLRTWFCLFLVLCAALMIFKA